MKNLILILSAFVLFSCSKNATLSVKSPDESIQLQFGVDKSSAAWYSVSYNDSVLIRPSALGFDVDGQPGFGKNVRILSTETEEVNDLWEPVYGEKNEIQNHYHSLKIHLKEKDSPNRSFDITFRVYDEGVAFNYTFLPQENVSSLTIQKELTEFNFTNDFFCWVSDRAQSEYRKVTLNEVTKPAERPFVVEAGNSFVSLGEARLIDFSRMKLTAGVKPNSLVANLFDEPTVTLPYTTPWRTIMPGKTAGELLEHDYMLLNLNEPCAIKDVSWIKPGKVIRETTLTTKGGLACVDFAASHGLQFVEFDAGWYGPENDDSSDATTVTVDPKRSPGPLDLQKVIDYGKSKGIGIILYVNRRALEKQIDQIFPLYQAWGVKGVKFGFVQVGSQKWTTWLHQAVEKAADNQLMVDIHDEYRPTGFSRTYPNLMTQEGIRGDEESPTNGHTLITLFTRLLAGAGDNTICYFAPRVTEKMGGHVSQLAKAAMLYSPWQFLFWYDRPPNSTDVMGGVPGGKGFIQNVPELEFFKEIPTVWDDTKVLESKIGEYATVARKSDTDWFLGSLTGNDAKTVKLNLDFLDPGTNYEATIYTHDESVPTPTHVKIDKQQVKDDTTLSFDIEANSGLAIHFQKK